MTADHLTIPEFLRQYEECVGTVEAYTCVPPDLLFVHFIELSFVITPFESMHRTFQSVNNVIEDYVCELI
jgi:hypothetical protein